jgi:hypothetical protein
MSADARRFTSTLCLVFGPLFIGGGFLAAFTPDGALYIFVGLSALVLGVLLCTRVPLWAAVTTSGLVFALLMVK